MQTVKMTSREKLVGYLSWCDREARANGRETFTCYSKHLQNRIGDDYAAEMTQLRAAGILVLVKNHQFIAGRKGLGRCRTYRWNRTVAESFEHTDVKIDELLKNPDISDEHREYLEIRQRTNLTGNPRFTTGRDGDSRVYTDFSSLSKAQKSQLTIDGEATVGLDIANAHPVFVLQELKKAGVKIEDELLDWAQSGRLYDNFAELLQVPRESAKFGINKMFNAPSKLRFGTFVDTTRKFSIGGFNVTIPGGYTEKTQRDIEAAAVVHALKNLFPSAYKAIRNLARSRKTYFVGAKRETEIRRAFQLACKTRDIPLLTNHDGLFCKTSDLHSVWSIYQNIKTRFGQFTLTIDTPPSSFSFNPPPIEGGVGSTANHSSTIISGKADKLAGKSGDSGGGGACGSSPIDDNGIWRQDWSWLYE